MERKRTECLFPSFDYQFVLLFCPLTLIVLIIMIIIVIIIIIIIDTYLRLSSCEHNALTMEI